MKFPRFAQIALVLSFAFLAAPPSSHAWDRGDVDTFATLPAGTANPEGIAIDPQKGDVYVADLDVSGNTTVGNVVVFDRKGRFLRKLDVSGSSTLLLGLAFHPQTHQLLVIDYGSHKVLRVNPTTGAATLFTDLGAGAGPNALTFDAAGNVYISDSSQGIIWRTASSGGAATAWISSPLLTTTGVPPFGANGLAFNKAATTLFVANTGNDTVVKIPLPNGPAGTPGAAAVFVNSINGADGLIIDGDDNLWIAANQADEIVVVNPNGKVIAKLGDFDGIDRRGSPQGLLFPASLVFNADGDLLVTNLSLDLRVFGLPPTVDSEWAAAVTRHTVARIRLRHDHGHW